GVATQPVKGAGTETWTPRLSWRRGGPRAYADISDGGQSRSGGLRSTRTSSAGPSRGGSRQDFFTNSDLTLLKRKWNLARGERAKLKEIAAQNMRLFRAYLLKEDLAAILDGNDVETARAELQEWLAWASRSKLKPFVKLARTIRKHMEGILAYIRSGLSNGRTEGLNGKARVITRRSFGFHSASSLIAMLFLCCGGLTLSPVRKMPFGSH